MFNANSSRRSFLGKAAAALGLLGSGGLKGLAGDERNSDMGIDFADAVENMKSNGKLASVIEAAKHKVDMDLADAITAVRPLVHMPPAVASTYGVAPLYWYARPKVELADKVACPPLIEQLASRLRRREAGAVSDLLCARLADAWQCESMTKPWPSFEVVSDPGPVGSEQLSPEGKLVWQRYYSPVCEISWDEISGHTLLIIGAAGFTIFERLEQLLEAACIMHTKLLPDSKYTKTCKRTPLSFIAEEHLGTLNICASLRAAGILRNIHPPKH